MRHETFQMHMKSWACVNYISDPQSFKDAGMNILRMITLYIWWIRKGQFYYPTGFGNPDIMCS